MAKKKSFEDKLSRFAEIAEKMESADTGLEESLELYKEGTLLAAELAKTIEKAENEIVELREKSNGETEEVPFN